MAAPDAVSEREREAWPPGYRRGPEPNPFADLVDRENPVIEVVDWETALRLRSMSGVERVDGFHRMMASAANLMVRGLRRLHPEWAEDRLGAELRRRTRGVA